MKWKKYLIPTELSPLNMEGQNITTYPVAELNHFRDYLFIDRWEDGTPDKFHVFTGELIHIYLHRKFTFRKKQPAVKSCWYVWNITEASTHLGEPVEEWFWEALATSALCEGILTAKDLGLLVLHLETHAQLWDVDLCSMVEAGVQSFQHRLRGQIQLQWRKINKV